MNTEHTSSAGQGNQPLDEESLASLLAPVLMAECRGRLSKPIWFRSAWQASRSVTGYATYRFDDGRSVEAVVKLPVTPNEYRWTTGLELDQSVDASQQTAHPVDTCTPRVLAAGVELGDYDLAWLVVEKLAGPPLNKQLDKLAVEELLLAATRWYARASHIRDISKAPAAAEEDWAALLTRAREAVRTSGSGLAEGQRWNEAIRQTQRVLPVLVEQWRSRPINTWCHGDLHPGNAMRRSSGCEGSTTGEASRSNCVLIDFALVHAGHWVEDAAYLERLYWGKPELLCGVKPVSLIAQLLRESGRLRGGEDYARLANVRRVLMAASVPAFLEREGHPKYVHAALEVLEKTLGLV